MPTTPGVLYEVRGRVALVTLNNPERRNAFQDAMREQLAAHLATAAADSQVRAVVITGAGKAFSAGGDLSYLQQIRDSGDPAPLLRFLEHAHAAIQAIRELPKPVIAAVNGAAAGAGCNLALACDLRVAGEDSSFTEAFVRVGLVMDWGGTWTLPRLVGPARAAEMALSGKPVDARTALAWGLVNRVVPADRVLPEAMAWAEELAAGPAQAQAMAKRLMASAGAQSLPQAMDAERLAQAELLMGPEAGEGMAAFLEKRAARFP